MKTKDKYFKIISILITLFLLISSVSVLSFGQELTGEEIINKVVESGYFHLILWIINIESNVILAQRVSCRKYSLSE